MTSLLFIQIAWLRECLLGFFTCIAAGGYILKAPVLGMGSSPLRRVQRDGRTACPFFLPREKAMTRHILEAVCSPHQIPVLAGRSGTTWPQEP